MLHYIDVDEGMKQVIDIVSITTVFGTLMGALPSIAAILSIAWSALRIYETKTIQRFIARIQEKDDGKNV
jgi:hypothetical protein